MRSMFFLGIAVFSYSISIYAMNQKPTQEQVEWQKDTGKVIKWVVAPVAVGAGFGYVAGLPLGFEYEGAMLGGLLGVQAATTVLAVRPYVPGRW